MLRNILILGRVSNLPTVWTNVLAGWFMAGESWSLELLWLIVGVSLLYVAGMTLNDAFDVEWDREHAPERPIPSGGISLKAAWLLGLGQLAVGYLLVDAATDAPSDWVALLAGAIVLYNWIHKKTPWAVILMGACRALVYLVSASAALGTAQLTRMPWIVEVAAGIMGLYVIGITLAARTERTDAKRPIGVLARICLNAPFLLLVLATKQMGPGLFKAVLFAVSILAVLSWMVLAEYYLRTQKGVGIALSIAGITLIDAAAVSYVDWRVGLLCLLLLPVTLLFQSKVPAT